MTGDAECLTEVDFFAEVVELLVGLGDFLIRRAVDRFDRLLNRGHVEVLTFGQRRELLHRFTEAVSDSLVLLVLDDEGGGDGPLGVSTVEEAEGADGFEANARVLILDGGFDNPDGIRDTVALVADDADRLGAGIMLGRLQEGLDEVEVHRVMPLVDPEGFEDVVSVRLLGGVELLHPLLGRGDDFSAVVLVQFDLGALADVIFVFLEELEEVRDGFTKDLLRRQ